MRKTGESVIRFHPYWHVVERPDHKFIVVDTSATPVPLQVFGPTTRPKAEEWARNESLLFLALKGSLVFPDFRGE